MDRLAIAEDGMTGFALITKAGQFMFDSIRQSCPNAKSLLVFCCVGNNAGDGYIIARLAIHAKAADRAVSEKGERGLFATDLYPYLRELVN